MFYDNWVARDINGTALENAPFEQVFHHHESSWRFQRHLPIQVQSCWNGIAVLDPAPLYDLKPIRFRMANIAHGECSASECSLIANDYWAAGYGRIITVPRVKLAYDKVCLRSHAFVPGCVLILRWDILTFHLTLICGIRRNRKCMKPSIPTEGILPPFAGTRDLAASRMTHAQILKIVHGTAPTTVCSYQRRAKS